ncbi:MAG TPA: ABC transporter ATP-binding protein [Burkholderiales bacterium]|nr:ABC transporter ATP-binding protein [Burkholderiales bacterium]
MLRVADLTAGYGAAPVLQGVSLQVGAGDTVALLGPNGAGKSTLLAALTGTLPRRRGAIVFQDHDLIASQSHDIVARGIALVPEGRHVFAPFSVQDNLRLGAVRLKGGRDALRERYEYAYALFPRLYERRAQAAGTLSGGEQQMLAIGRALMSAPRLLLLDESFLGLAPLIVAEILAALEKLTRAGLTLLIVEQKLDIALTFAQRAYVLIKGRVALEDSTERLAGRPDLSDLYFSLATSAASSAPSRS